MINKKRLIRLTQALIRIDSQNPGADESAIAHFVKNYLRRLGVKVRLVAFKKNRPNVIAVLEGINTKRSLLITPHLDTVPQGKNWRFPPMGAKIYQGKIYGLGATDCKGNAACALEAINSLVEDKVILGYNLILAATADEECGSGLGLAPLLEKGILKPDACLVLDSDDFKLIVSQKGLLHLKVEIQGMRAHGAYPWRGINAIGLAINILKEIEAIKLKFTANRYLKRPTVNIGTIRGGDKVNIVADWCEFELDFRFLPGMTEKPFLRKLRNIIRKYTPSFKIEIEGVQKPYAIAKSHILVSQIARAMRELKITPRISGSEGATTITFFQDKFIPALATGFGSGGCAHTADEYVKIGNLCKGAKVLENFLKNFKFN